MRRNPDKSVTNRKNNTNRFKHLEAELDKVINIIKDYRFNKNRQVAIAKPFERFSDQLRLSNLEFFILLTARDDVKSMIAEMKQKKLNEEDIEELEALKKLTSVLTESHIEQLTEVKTWLHYNQKLYESYLNRHNPIRPPKNYNHNLSELANEINADKLRYKTHQKLDILPDPNKTQYLNECKTVIAEKIKEDLTYIDSLISEFLTEKSKAPTQPPEPNIYVKQEETSENIVSRGLGVLRAFIAGPSDLPPPEEDSPREKAPNVESLVKAFEEKGREENVLDQIGSAINSVGKLIAGSETRYPLTKTQNNSPSEKAPNVVVKRLIANIEEKKRQGNETNKPVQRKAYPNERRTHHPPAAMKATRPFRNTDKDYSEEQINNAVKQAEINSKKNKYIAVPDKSSKKITRSHLVSETPTTSIFGSQHREVAQLVGEDAREKGVNPDSKPATRYI